LVQKSDVDERFRYVDGDLFWENGPREGEKAGWVSDNGYTYINFLCGGKRVRMLKHRIIFLMHHGYLPDSVDHVDRNSRNDCIENLRESNKSQNALNTDPRANNKSGYKGVWEDRNGKFQASVYMRGKKVYLGTYDSIEEAVNRIGGWREFRGL
jgi:hypothetical protein